MVFNLGSVMSGACFFPRAYAIHVLQRGWARVGAAAQNTGYLGISLSKTLVTSLLFASRTQTVPSSRLLSTLSSTGDAKLLLPLLPKPLAGGH